MKAILHRFALLLLPTLVAHGAPTAPAVLTAEFINPGSRYPSCHASTLAETTQGRLFAAWFGGTAEGRPDVCIYLAERGASGWMPGRLIADGVQPDGRRYPCWNPVLVQPRNGPLLLFYKVGPSPEAWWGLMMASADGGRTWSSPRRLPAGILGPIKDKPVELADGTLLCGSSTEDPRKGWQLHLELTPDCGRTWSRVGPINRADEYNAIQPTFLRHADGRIQLICRTKEMVLATAWSSDGGRSWSRLAPSGLFAPNSGIDALTLADGRHLVVYNYRRAARVGPPGSKAAVLGGGFGTRHLGEDSGARWPLNLALSSDGLHWTMVLTLEDEPRPQGYAYPAVIQTRDGLVHVSYTWNREVIKHVVLDPKRLQASGQVITAMSASLSQR